MATVQAIVQSAYRRSGVIGTGVTIRAHQRDVGIELLQDMYRDLAAGALGKLTDTYLTTDADYEAQEFQRVFNMAGATITLPPQVLDSPLGPIPYEFESSVLGATNKRPPCDGCVIQVVVPGADPHTYLFDSGRAEWQDIEGLVATSRAPLSSRYNSHLCNLLAVYVADDVGTQIGPVLAKRAGNAKLAFASRQGSQRPVTPVEFF